MKVYIATARGYEHTQLIKAFATEAQAKAWKEACNEYDNDPKRPRYSEDESEEYFDKRFEKERKKIARWEAKHPAGPYNVDEWYGWVEFEIVQPVGAQGDEIPTHWMPLPSGPMTKYEGKT